MMEFCIRDPDLRQIRDEIYNCMLNEYKKELTEVLRQKKNESGYSVIVSYESIHFNCPKTSALLIHFPENVFQEVDKAAMKALVEHYEIERVTNDNLTLKDKIHIRLRADSINKSSPLLCHEFPDCSASGKYFILAGTVTTIGPVKSLEYQRPYQCSVCHTIVKIKGQASRGYFYQKNVKAECPNSCKPGKFILKDATKEDLIDYQEIKIQENVNGTNYGANSKAYIVVLEEDLINTSKPGDNVYIGGWLFIRYKPFRVGHKMEGQLFFKANHVSVTNADQSTCVPTVEQVKQFENFWKAHESNPLVGRDLIVKSFCFELCGMYPVKLALLLGIIGGMTKLDDGSKVRGQSHIILVGDPGIGKSQILQYCSKLIPRSVYTTGSGSSAAGLTVSAVKINNDWELQAGALVLADSGLCCIDEFTILDKKESASIHEAMEQQTISVAKASITCKISTRCTIFAAANPKSITRMANNKYEVDIGISSPLLSRFDLVLLLVDEHNPDWDERFCDFLLGLETSINDETPIFDSDSLRRYIGHVKKFDVEVCDDIRLILRNYYMYQRKSQLERSVHVTARLLEGLMRLTEAHARLMYRTRALVMDAVTAITLMEYSLHSTNLIGTASTSVTQVLFPDNPLQSYNDIAKTVLNFLNLNATWLKEKEWLDSLATVVNESPKGNSNNGASLFRGSYSNQEYMQVSKEQYEWFHGDTGSQNDICPTASSVAVLSKAVPSTSKALRAAEAQAKLQAKFNKK